MSENTDLDPVWLILPEHNYAIRFAPDAYAIEFKVFAAAASKSADTDWSWGLFDGENAREFHEWQSAFWEIGGALKWDGCINWETNPECMVHGCSPGHADEITAIFRAVYTIGKRYFDLLDDPVAPLPDEAIEAREGQFVPAVVA